MQTVIILIVAIIILLPFTLKALASMDIHFTFIETNHAKFIEKAGVLCKILAEAPGKIFDLKTAKGNFKKAEIREIKDGERPAHDTFLYRTFGIYFYGIYPFRKVKKIKIVKEKENIAATGPQDWIISEGTVLVTGLRTVFPRVFVFTAVELKDGLTVHLKLVVKFKVIVPYIPVYEFGGNFFTQAASILQSEVIDELRLVATIQDF